MFTFKLLKKDRGNLGLEFSVEWFSALNTDLKAIKKILIEAFGEAYNAFSESDLKLKPGYKVKQITSIPEEFFDNINLGKYQHVVLKVNEQVVACAAISIHYPDKSSNRIPSKMVSLEYLAVNPLLKGRGLGRELIHAILHRFDGMNGMDLYTRNLPTGAPDFYTRMDFHQASLEELDIPLNTSWEGYDKTLSKADFIGFFYPPKLTRHHSVPDFRKLEPNSKKYVDEDVSDDGSNIAAMSLGSQCESMLSISDSSGVGSSSNQAGHRFFQRLPAHSERDGSRETYCGFNPGFLLGHRF